MLSLGDDRWLVLGCDGGCPLWESLVLEAASCDVS